MVERVRRVGGEVLILRFKPVTQVAHIFLVIGMILSFLTGLAFFFKFGERQLFSGWGKALGLPKSPPTSQLISILHDILGPVFMLIGIVIALVFSVRASSIRMALPTRKDVSDLIWVIKNRLGLVKSRPEFDFYNPLQKIWIWTVVVGLILTGVSGIFLVVEKWFKIVVLSNYMRGFMSLLHIIGAFMFYVALPIHFIMAISPINWPILKSQFTFKGYVKLAWWRLHHPAYLRKILSEDMDVEAMQAGSGGGQA